MNIDVPKCDQYLDPECEGDEQIPFRRSIYDSTSYPRNQMNIITSWVDGSQIYGSSKEVGDRLRRFKLGKMK